MKLDLLTLTRHAYIEQHPDRDSRMMPTDDTFLAFVDAVEEVLAGQAARISRLEARLTAKDAE